MPRLVVKMVLTYQSLRYFLGAFRDPRTTFWELLACFVPTLLLLFSQTGSAEQIQGNTRTQSKPTELWSSAFRSERGLGQHCIITRLRQETRNGPAEKTASGTPVGHQPKPLASCVLHSRQFIYSTSPMPTPALDNRKCSAHFSVPTGGPALPCPTPSDVQYNSLWRSEF